MTLYKCSLVITLLWSIWRCLAGTFVWFFEIPHQKFLLLIYWWVQQYPVTQAASESEVVKGTAVQWICGWRLINHDDMTSGTVCTNIVQSCFSHKSRVCIFVLRIAYLFWFQLHRGHAPVNPVWHGTYQSHFCIGICAGSPPVGRCNTPPNYPAAYQTIDWSSQWSMGSLLHVHPQYSRTLLTSSYWSPHQPHRELYFDQRSKQSSSVWKGVIAIHIWMNLCEGSAMERLQGWHLL